MASLTVPLAFALTWTVAKSMCKVCTKVARAISDDHPRCFPFASPLHIHLRTHTAPQSCMRTHARIHTVCHLPQVSGGSGDLHDSSGYRGYLSRAQRRSDRPSYSLRPPGPLDGTGGGGGKCGTGGCVAGCVCAEGRSESVGCERGAGSALCYWADCERHGQ
jgi:hypothetical protein